MTLGQTLSLFPGKFGSYLSVLAAFKSLFMKPILSSKSSSKGALISEGTTNCCFEFMPREIIERTYGISSPLCDYILKHQIAEARPRQIIDFGAGAGKIGKIAREILGEHVKLVAIEGYKTTADMLTKEKLYDEVHQILIQDWIYSANKEVYDLAVFGDVLEHLKPREIRKVINQCIRFFKEIIIICPLYDIFQDDFYRNPLEAHKTYITSTFFDRYNPVEKHIIRGKEWIIMNVCILSKFEPKALYRRSFWFAFHKCMLILQPIGLARLFVNFLKRFFIKFKWLLRD